MSKRICFESLPACILYAIRVQNSVYFFYYATVTRHTLYIIMCILGQTYTTFVKEREIFTETWGLLTIFFNYIYHCDLA